MVSVLASFDPMEFANSVNLGCRSGSGSNCPKYTALAVSLSYKGGYGFRQMNIILVLF